MSALTLRRRAARNWAAGACMMLCGPSVWALAAASTADDQPAVHNSRLDAPLFYQLLIGEIELTEGHAGNAYAVMLDAARRTRDAQLFRRATEIALRARAGDQALAATQAWRTALPQSAEAMQLQAQILLQLNRLDDLAEPLGALLKVTPPQGRAVLIASLPRFMLRAGDKAQAAKTLQSVLQPYAGDAATAVAVKVAMGRMWLGAADVDRAWTLAREAHDAAPDAPQPVLLAMQMIAAKPDAQTLVDSYLDRPDAAVVVRRAYASVLINAQRYDDAILQLQAVTRQQPDLAAPWLALGALQVELRQSQMAEQSLQRYLQLAQQPLPPQAAASAASGADDGDEHEASSAAATEQGMTQAWLLLAQAAEQRGDYAGAESWLAHVDDPQRALEVQIRRASLLARQGRLEEARRLLRTAPERSEADARAKLLAEAQLLREAKQWGDAFEVLGAASQRFPDDADVLYEQAMMAEKLDRLDTMEQLLRRVMALKPDYAQAYNALGYSLADRNVRLPEAKKLIERALTLQPGDPFITDSLGWVEFRMGNHDEAIRQLRTAYAKRQDPEIAAHLGEVLWAAGRRDEARQVWAAATQRDADNDVLRETLARLKASP